MSKPTLVYHYFDIRARGEPMRWVLKMTGAKFEDERIAPQTWPDRKPGFEWGQLPVLDVNGVQLHQSLAICRYLARTYGLAPESTFEQARLEELAEQINEIMAKIGGCIGTRRMNTPEQMPEKIAELVEITEKIMGKIETFVSNEGWIRSRRMTWVDVYAACFLDMLETHIPDTVHKFPKLLRMMKEVKRHPAIQGWINERPPLTPMESKF